MVINHLLSGSQSCKIMSWGSLPTRYTLDADSSSNSRRIFWHVWGRGFQKTKPHVPIWMFPKIVVPPNHPILIGLSTINHPFWGSPIFGNTYITLDASETPNEKNHRLDVYEKKPCIIIYQPPPASPDFWSINSSGKSCPNPRYDQASQELSKPFLLRPHLKRVLDAKMTPNTKQFLKQKNNS